MNGQKVTPSLPGGQDSSNGSSPFPAFAAGTVNSIAQVTADPPLTMDRICPQSPLTKWWLTRVSLVTGIGGRSPTASNTQAVPVPTMTSPAFIEHVPSAAAY